MRWVLAILFSLNVVLFLWIQLGPQTESPAHKLRSEPLDFGTIQLLQELASKPPVQARVDMSDDKQLPNDIPIYCGELGPFPSRNMAEGFRRKLAPGRGKQVRVESRWGKAAVGYWVMIPPLATADEAEAMLQRLRQAGFKDLWLMRKGAFTNSISMGLYTEKRYAKRHGEAIRRKGFKTRIVPKKKNERLFWVVFSGIQENFLRALENGTLPQGVALHKKVCSQGSAGN